MERPGHDADRPVETAAALRSEKTARRRNIRRSHLVVGEVDHEALTREIIARFPKLLAELAK
ncbi:MAG TPA: hypothetical protein VJ770_09385 [Stellaceae bacterium]|nr:hypothetical protein [Stellaceae bacterium]